MPDILREEVLQRHEIRWYHLDWNKPVPSHVQRRTERLVLFISFISPSELSHKFSGASKAVLAVDHRRVPKKSINADLHLNP